MKLNQTLTGSIAALLFLAADKAAAAGGDAPPVFTLKPTPPIVETTDIELKKLVIDAGTQPRVAIDDEVVKEYTETIKVAVKEEQPNPFDALPDDKLPQVFRDSTGRCVLADGFHRFAGHKGAHVKEMRVAIRDGDEKDALIFSLGTNQDHGVRRTNKDKARAVKIAVNDPDLATLGNSELARICGVSEFMVRDNRPAKAPTTRTVVMKGKKTTMKTGGIGKKGGKAKTQKAAKASKRPANDPAELDKLLLKIVDIIGAPDGGKFRAAVNDQSLDLSIRDIRDLAELSPAKVKAVFPLVAGGPRMKPAKAFDFIGSELPEKMLVELHNRAIGTANGTYSYDGEGFTVTVQLTGKKK